MSEIVTLLATIAQLEAAGTVPRLVLDRVKRDCRELLDAHDRGQERERLRAEGRLARLCATYGMSGPTY